MRHGGIRDLKGKLVGMAGFRNPVQAPQRAVARETNVAIAM